MDLGGAYEIAGVYVKEIITVYAPRAEIREDWARRIKAPTCACGCGGKTEVFPAHRTKGVPQYLHGHPPNSHHDSSDPAPR